MRLYAESSEQFIQDIRENRLTDIMSDNFHVKLGRKPSDSEINSWQNSLPRVRDLIEVAGLRNTMLALEYEVPYNQNRIDCLLFGKSNDDCSNVVLIELKQWSSVKALEDEGNFVETYTGHKERVVPHPSQQVKGYHDYLKGFISEFENKPPLFLFSCAYCHNYKKDDGDGLFSPIYQELIKEYPVFTKDDVRQLAGRIKDLLAAGSSFEIFNRFMQSTIRPSKKLLDNVSQIIKNEAVFSLLNEQLEAKNLIWSKVRKADKSKRKSVIIVYGGPGTGKSVIAINVLAEVAQRGKKVFYGCKSKPFTEGLKKLVGRDGELLFSNLYRFLPTRIKENELDLLLVDEAHRIEKKSNHQFTKHEDRTEIPQIEQLIRCSKTSVFFIDDKQNVRSQEMGSSELIRDAARKLSGNVSEVTLNTQFRCMGSNDYLLWLESMLGYTQEKRILRKNEVFDFKIFDSPQEIYRLLLEKEKTKPNSARMVAGFCWPWSQSLDSNGNLVNDVVIGDFAMPWETHGKITRPPAGFVKWYEWAYRPEGVKQVGCIYTAQGFEFDYIGVIIGSDLVYDAKRDCLAADITATKDPTLRRGRVTFESHVKNIYRTLLSRGMRGCYVYFVDKETERFVRSRMETAPSVVVRKEAVAEGRAIPVGIPARPSIVPFRRLPPHEVHPFKNCVPIYDLKAAAGRFSDEQQITGLLQGLEAQHPEEFEWAELPSDFPPQQGLFIAQVVGESMNRRIPNGAWCLFRLSPAGTRQGKVVLVQHREIHDSDTGGHFTVKTYDSEKEYLPDGTWKHSRIVLRPDTSSPGYEPIVLNPESAEDLLVIAELVAVLG